MIIQDIITVEFGFCVFPGGSEVKVSAWNAGDPGSIPRLGRYPWRRKWQPTPVFLPGKSPGQKSLAGYRPRGYKRVRHDLVTKEQQHVQSAEDPEVYQTPREELRI